MSIAEFLGDIPVVFEPGMVAGVPVYTAEFDFEQVHHVLVAFRGNLVSLGYPRFANLEERAQARLEAISEQLVPIVRAIDSGNPLPECSHCKTRNIYIDGACSMCGKKEA